jgi:hypothetical protein
MRNIMLGMIVISSLLPTIGFAEETSDTYIKEAQDRYNSALQQTRQEEVGMQQQAAAVQANAIAIALQPKAATVPAPTTSQQTPAAPQNTNQQPAAKSDSWTKPNPWANPQPNPWANPAPSNNQQGGNSQSPSAPAPAPTNIYLPPTNSSSPPK